MATFTAPHPTCTVRGWVSPKNRVVKSIPSFHFARRKSKQIFWSIPENGAVSRHTSKQVATSSLNGENQGGNVEKYKRSLENLFCYDKEIPEEIIEEPVGLISMNEKNIGSSPRCSGCETKGAVLCDTCSGSGLYIDSILESQGILVKVRCLGCGGTGNIMCSECGGRGHL